MHKNAKNGSVCVQFDKTKKKSRSKEFSNARIVNPTLPYTLILKKEVRSKVLTGGN